ncbi:MAG: tetraprenyl-beta-curcumene synthase family protein [Thermodesulfobacteriota bacterium]|nr:tetraprenyl-beta-curcumene synthase family protein [Thermodesulfobacteriota bacterium]
MIIPNSPWTMMAQACLNVLPSAHRCLNRWKNLAEQIPDPELRRQALMSIRTKTFHCEGGSAYGLLAGDKCQEAIRFIVAYQTISDYLDNLCDRTTSSDPADFRALHESMIHALAPGTTCSDYYRFRDERDDGGYLISLVATCQDVLTHLPAFAKISPSLNELADYYCDLQVYKHVKEANRVPCLKSWFETYRNDMPEMTWYEFSACCGSTLGIFCLVACAFDEQCSDNMVSNIAKAYFPWVQGFHILLDYFIDQEEDLLAKDLNFCSYYKNDEEILQRLTYFFNQADINTFGLPNPRFHRMVNRGLFAIYLSDKKVGRQEAVRRIARKLIRRGGWTAWFFYLNGWIYRRLN